MARATRCCGRPSPSQRLERAAAKNGYRPGVHESRGLYVGQWQDDVKQGKGKKIYTNKTIYEGDWIANERHGFGVLMKKVNGYFVFVYEGQWINNRIAKGKLYEKSGIYDGTFSTTSGVARMKCGYGTMWWNDGTVYRGHWRNDVYDGKGRLVEVNGNFYNGQWSNGLKHGEGVYVFCDKGLIMEGIWMDGVPKVSEIKHFNMRSVDTTTPRFLMPKISKSDKRNVREAYESSRTETLRSLRKMSPQS